MPNKSLWRDDFLWDAYELAKDGTTEASIAKILGISLPTFIGWEKHKHLFKQALIRGRAAHKRRTRHNGNEIEDYIYNRLSDEERFVWRKIMKAHKTNRGKDIVKAILDKQGKLFRQHLFVHAMIHGNYSITKACNKIGISVSAFEKWQQEDPEFVKLFRVIQEAKKDRLEDHFFRLVDQNEVSPVIHGLKTLAGDRGYREKQQVDVNVSGNINHSLIQIDVNQLPLEVRSVVLAEVRKVKQITATTLPQLLPAINMPTEEHVHSEQA